jgi:hypothetical protein
MEWHDCLGIAAIVASLLASGVSIWAHLRINRIQRIQRFTTTGSHSPIVATDNTGRQFTINSGGGNVTIQLGGSSS